MTTITIEFECCDRVYEVPTSIPENGSALRHASTVDTVINLVDLLMHERECSA